MENSSLLTIALPLALGIIMLGLGLSLTIADFKRVVHQPKAIFIGLGCQMLVLPAICMLVAIIFGLPAELSVGLMLLSASPGGPTANLYSHLAKGDVALNISLTAMNSLLSLFTLPFIVDWSIKYFMKTGTVIPMQPKKIVEVFAIVLLPVITGMIVNARFASLSKKLGKPVKFLSALFLILIVAAAMIKEKDQLPIYFQQLGLACLSFNILSMLVGYFVPLLFKIGRTQSIAIGMEIGIHNGTLAIYIALNIIGNSTMSIPPSVYGVLMFFTAAAFGYLVSRNNAVS